MKNWNTEPKPTSPQLLECTISLAIWILMIRMSWHFYLSDADAIMKQDMLHEHIWQEQYNTVTWKVEVCFRWMVIMKEKEETALRISVGTCVKSPAKAAILDTRTQRWCENRSLVTWIQFSVKRPFTASEKNRNKTSLTFGNQTMPLE